MKLKNEFIAFSSMKTTISLFLLFNSVLANYFIGDDILNLPRYKVSLLADNKLPHSQLQQVCIMII